MLLMHHAWWSYSQHWSQWRTTKSAVCKSTNMKRQLSEWTRSQNQTIVTSLLLPITKSNAVGTAVGKGKAHMYCRKHQFVWSVMQKTDVSVSATVAKHRISSTYIQKPNMCTVSCASHNSQSMMYHLCTTRAKGAMSSITALPLSFLGVAELRSGSFDAPCSSSSPTIAEPISHHPNRGFPAHEFEPVAIFADRFHVVHAQYCQQHSAKLRFLSLSWAYCSALQTTDKILGNSSYDLFLQKADIATDLMHMYTHAYMCIRSMHIRITCYRT